MQVVRTVKFAADLWSYVESHLAGCLSSLLFFSRRATDRAAVIGDR